MAKDVYEELVALSQRHQRLRELFSVFRNESVSILTAPGLLKGLVIGELKEPAHFDVTFAGATVRFAFSFDAVASRGKVTCSRVDPWESNKTDAFGKFTFNGQGETELKVPDGPNEGDPIHVNMDAGAAFLIATYLRKAIRPDAPVVSVIPLRV